MAEPLRPAAAKVFGRWNQVFVPAIAGYATGTGPTVTELTGASSLDMTNILFDDAPFDPQATTNLVDQNARLGDTETYQFVGKTAWAGGSPKYAYDPQGADGDDGVKAYEMLQQAADGTTVTGFMVSRKAIAQGVDFAAGQFVDVYPVEFGPSTPTNDGTAEAMEAGQSVSIAITGKPLPRAAIVAGS
ncbi:MAG: hypothetical protein FWD95_01805 [Nocardioidaceae bacterium]|nr:hypothetical protein [Nocardioidaceae bacterium]